MQEKEGPDPYRGEDVVEIDIFEMLEKLWQNKLLIVGITLLFGLLAGVVSMQITPTYESEMVLSIPDLSDEDTYSMNLSEYAALFRSPTLMENISQEHELDFRQVSRRYELDINESDRLFNIQAAADNPSSAQSLNQTAYQEFNSLIHDYLEEIMEDRIATAEEELAVRESEYRSTQAELDSFDREHSLTVLSRREENLIEEQSLKEAELKELRSVVIPAGQKRVSFLEEHLSTQERMVGRAENPGLIPRFSFQEEEINYEGLSLINPNYVYVERLLTENLLELTDGQSRINILEDRLAELENELKQIRENRVDLENERGELARQRDLALARMESTREQRDDLVSSRSFVLQNSEPRLVSIPDLPDSPSSPRTRLNTAIALFLGLMLSVFVVFFVEAWRSHKKEER